MHKHLYERAFKLKVNMSEVNLMERIPSLTWTEGDLRVCLKVWLVDLHLRINSSKYLGGIKTAHCCYFKVDGRREHTHADAAVCSVS